MCDLSGFLARGAPLNQVTITQVSPPAKIGTESIGGKSYPAYAVKMTITGRLTRIIDYIGYVENGVFRSARVQDVTINGTEDSWTGKFTVVLIAQR